MAKIKKNDEVIVITGKDKGKKGKILQIVSKSNSVIVSGVNIITKHVKQRDPEKPSGIIKKEAPIHISNVMLFDKEKGSGSRVSIKIDDKGNKVRYFKKSEKEVKTNN